MTELEPWVMPATVATAVVGMAVVLWRTYRVSPGGWSASGGSGGPFPCTECGRMLELERSGLTSLSPAETGMAVRAKPQLQGKRLAELVCPHCEASHCFTVHGRKLEYAGTNLYAPQARSNRCAECGKGVKPAPWRPGEYDGRLDRAPDMPADTGLVCARCQAVVCASCARRATRGQYQSGGYRCPRCHRYPVDKAFQP